MINDLSEFLKDYPELGEPDQPGKPIYSNKEFQDRLHSLCEGIINMEILYSYERHMITVLIHANTIMKYLAGSDILKPLCFTDYQLFLKLTIVIGRLKNILIDSNCTTLNNAHVNIYFSYILEQRIIDNYKTRLEVFQTKCNEEEILHMNSLFTSFLIEHIRITSKSIDKMYLLANLEYLLKVGDLNIIIDKFHKISRVMPSYRKIPLLQKITAFFIENNTLGTFKSLKSDNNSRLDFVSMCYFICQNICKQLDEQKLNETSQIFSMLDPRTLIVICDPDVRNFCLEEAYEESVNLITFKKYKVIKTVSSDEIKKHLEMLSLLLNSLKKYKYNSYSPFGILLVSMLNEFVMGTDLNKSCIISLIDLIMGYLFISTLPSNFGAVSYALHIYQKLKSDNELEMKSSVMFGKLVTLDLFDLKKNIRDDLEELINSNEDWVDKSVILSRFLNNSIKSEDETLDNLFYALNEYVVLSSQYKLKNGVLLFPYTVSLCYSLKKKNEDCLFNNMALLNNYFDILMDPGQMIPICDKNYFLTVIVRNYKDISQCLPDDFLIKSWKFVMTPESMDLKISKQLLNLCGSNTLKEFIKILIIKTMNLVEVNEVIIYEIYYSYINEVWSTLLYMQFTRNKNKKVRKDLINHFCFTLNKTFLFYKTFPTEHGLILLMKIVCLLLKIPWINTTALMGCALRIMTSVETRNISQIQVLINAAELLIVLYKCPNNSIKPNLGLYMISFVDILSKCCAYAKAERERKTFNNDVNIPFHKLEKCSSLFKNNKNDFVFICPLIIESLIEVIMDGSRLTELLTKNCYHIIFNMMDMCSPNEMKQLMLNVRGPSLLILRNAYRDYLSSIRFTGRI